MAYGTIIPGLTIDGQPAPYGVVNERAVRATAGIMFLVGIVTFFITRTTGDTRMLLVVVPVFWLDFLLKTLLSPQWSIFGILGRFLVRAQKPEWVGAIQKRFAWSIGLALSSTMLILTLGFGMRGWVPISICLTCLTFMWMESALGICAGCHMYRWLVKHKLLPQPAVQPACPGGACTRRIG